MPLAGLMKHMKGVNKQIRQLEDACSHWEWTRGHVNRGCKMQKQYIRVLEEMGRDQHIHLLTPWSAERGCSS
jgi:hypothetical protein